MLRWVILVDTMNCGWKKGGSDVMIAYRWNNIEISSTRVANTALVMQLGKTWIVEGMLWVLSDIEGRGDLWRQLNTELGTAMSWVIRNMKLWAVTCAQSKIHTDYMRKIDRSDAVVHRRHRKNMKKFFKTLSNNVNNSCIREIMTSQVRFVNNTIRLWVNDR